MSRPKLQLLLLLSFNEYVIFEWIILKDNKREKPKSNLVKKIEKNNFYYYDLIIISPYYRNYYFYFVLLFPLRNSIHN